GGMYVRRLEDKLLLSDRRTTETGQCDESNRSRETANGCFFSHEFLPTLRGDDTEDVMARAPAYRSSTHIMHQNVAEATTTAVTGITSSTPRGAPDALALHPCGIREMDHMQKILITGAAGDVGSRLTALLRDTYQLRLSDMRTPAGLKPD